jgi:hypothetical protein
MPLARYTIAAATAALFMGGIAAAQPATSQGSSDNNANPPASAQPASAPAASDQGSATANTTAETAMPANSSAANISASVAADGTQVIASQPVPDTPANRAKYGKPMSNAGKRTPATGD